jgi:hypothetical protein
MAIEKYNNNIFKISHTHIHMHVCLHIKRHSIKFEQIVLKFNKHSETLFKTFMEKTENTGLIK